MNQTFLLGRVTKDIELKGNETKYCGFSIAVNRRTKEKETDFINCKAFGKTAEMLSAYVTKGQQIAIQGRIQTGSYEKDGKKVYTTDIIIDSFYFADGKRDKAEEATTTTTDNSYSDDSDLPF